MFTIHISDKEIVSEVYKELYQLNDKINKLKTAKDYTDTALKWTHESAVSTWEDWYSTGECKLKLQFIHQQPSQLILMAKIKVIIINLKNKEW